MMIPRSSKPVILAGIPTGRSAGVAIPAINPEILKSELSKLSTTKAYGVCIFKARRSDCNYGISGNCTCTL